MPTQTGTVRNVPAGNATAFQTAINSSTCGDTIVLAAGSTYSGNFTIPNKSCSGWILVESSGLASLPASGHRVGPSNVSNMAKVSTPNTSPAFTFLASSHNWRLMGLEITTSYVSTTNTVYNLVLSDGSLSSILTTMPSYVIFDRIYVHGLSTANTTRGIYMDFQSVGIVDSYCDEIHYNGSDSQCFLSTNGPGPFLIQNNFIQAESENIMFGGSDPSIANLIPSDITIVGNLIQKNTSWRGEAAPTNWGDDVKNLFELKNAQRVLLDGNVLQYTWAAAQDEVMILRSVNQGGTCTWCFVGDVTVTHNLIQHAISGIILDPCAGPISTNVCVPTGRIAIENNVLSDIDSTGLWGGSPCPSCSTWGNLFTLDADNGADNVIMHDITINHNTGFSSNSAMNLNGNGTTDIVQNVQFTNGLYAQGLQGLSTQGGVNIPVFLPTLTYNDVVLLNATGTQPVGIHHPAWLTGTSWSTLAGANFTSYSGTDAALSGNFQFTSSSPYYRAGTDGKDIGVWDWTTFNTETTNALTGVF
jgi:hypothetical protein